MDIYSAQNEVLLNPRWPQEDLAALTQLAEKAQNEQQLRGHVWIATSGSTSESIQGIKLVAISKQALIASAQSVNSYLKVTDKDIWTQVLPTFHVGGLGIHIRAELSGSKVVNALKDGKWDVDYFYKTVNENSCTLAALVPTQIYDLVQAGYLAPKSFRAIVVGGGAFSEDLYKKARNLGWPVLPSYGMTETSSQIATASLDSLLQSDYPSMDLLSHAEARTNSDGFVEVKALSLMTVYAQWKNSEPVCWDPKKEGWFVTEDQGEIRHRSIFVHGRSQDYIKIGGEGTNVSRLRQIFEACVGEIDNSLLQELVLIDMESDRLGKEIHLVTQSESPRIVEIEELYSQRVLPFEKIRRTHRVQSIPRSDLGKVLWKQLRNLL